MESLDVPAPAKLLDVPCGGGRHCIALAGRGYDMTGVDISTDFLTAAAQSVRRQSRQDRHWEQREMRDLPWPAEFDGAYSFGNSFGYLDDAGNAAVPEVGRGGAQARGPVRPRDGLCRRGASSRLAGAELVPDRRYATAGAAAL